MKNLLFCVLLLSVASVPSLGANMQEGNLGLGTPQDLFYSHYPPDPVNIKTGNFYFPSQDLFLPCFGIPLEVFRAYNSFSKANGPFGIGWSFNYDIKISIGSFSALRVLEADGFVNEYKPQNQPGAAKGETIDKIIDAKKEEDRKYSGNAKDEEFYDKLRIRLATDNDFFKRQKDRYVAEESKEVSDGVYISTMRGSSSIIKNKGTYSRIRPDGVKEFYNKNGEIVRIEDRNGNYLNFTLGQNGRVTRVSDGCSHYILIKYNQKGKITDITDSLGRVLKFKYDPLDRMISFQGADGATTQYIYNKQNFLEKIMFPKGETIEIAYDPLKGTVSEQRGPGKKVTKYTYLSKGPNYKSSVVQDNEGYYESFEFYADENKTVQKDKNAKQVITTYSKDCGKPLSVTDGRGVGYSYKLDNAGNILEKKDPAGVIVQYKYDPRFNFPTEITDQQGNKLTFLYDERGNLTYADLKDKGWVRIRYEKHGKYDSISDSSGNIINYVYNYCGKPTSIEKKVRQKTVGTIRVKYDATCDMADIKYSPNDPKIIDDIKKTIDNIFALLKPSGVDVQL